MITTQQIAELRAEVRQAVIRQCKQSHIGNLSIDDITQDVLALLCEHLNDKFDTAWIAGDVIIEYCLGVEIRFTSDNGRKHDIHEIDIAGGVDPLEAAALSELRNNVQTIVRDIRKQALYRLSRYAWEE